LVRAREPVEVAVDDEVLARVATCQVFAEEVVATGKPVYGSTTGFGPLVDYSGRSAAADQCDNTLSHLTTGHGPELDPALVRGAVLARLWSLTRGRSGVSPSVVTALVHLLRTRFAPAVPRLGSVGASGDLVPLAHLVQALRGIGWAYVDGIRMPARDALTAAGLEPLVLTGRDALGLVNGTSLTAAAAGLALSALRRSHNAALVLSAVMADLLGCEILYLDEDLLDAFGHPAAVEVARKMRLLLCDTKPSGARSLQEPYCIRCVPQLVGAAGTVLAQSADVITADLNGVNDNPLFFPEHRKVVHGGNFFGQPVAFAADQLTVMAVQLGNLAERQLDLLVDPHRNGGLPPMLATAPGQQHGVQGVQLVATATVADMRRTSTPASVQSIPTNLHNQDVVPFGTQAALNALDQARSLRWLHGALALSLRQAAYVGARRPTAPACAAIVDELAATIPAVDPDRPLQDDVHRAADVLDRADLPYEVASEFD
jgi:histidine ammonia-lyase/tyrosine ammonia-lyase